MGGNYEKGIYNQLVEVMERLDSFEKKHHLEVGRLNEEISQLKSENSKLKKENQLLKEDNARLKSIINNDSSNSSLPPSRDRKGTKAANQYNGRTQSGNKVGGQEGHTGTTLTKIEVEEKIRSGKIKHEIRTLGNVMSSRYVTKYVVDLDVIPKVTELRIYADNDGKVHIPPQYRSDVIYGANVKALAVSLYSEGVMSNDRIAAFLNAASGDMLGLSEGSVYSFCKRLADVSKASIERLEKHLLNQKSIATDATPVTVNGKQKHIRNFSVSDTVVYKAMSGKAIAALEKIEIMKQYAGIFIHDHETALYRFGSDHGECNVHLLRYLKKNTEETKNKWSEEMSGLLLEMKQKKAEQMGLKRTSFENEVLSEYEKRYREMIEKGLKENRNTSHRYAKMEEKTLLNRLEKYAHNHLLFIHDFAVPFDNNISERDLRKAKNRQKMAGGFRKDSGNEMYCSILTVIETLKRRKMPILAGLKKLFMGTPAIF